MKNTDKLLHVMFFSKVKCLGCGEDIIATDFIEHKSGFATCKNCEVDIELFNQMIWN